MVERRRCSLRDDLGFLGGARAVVVVVVVAAVVVEEEEEEGDSEGERVLRVESGVEEAAARGGLLAPDDDSADWELVTVRLE